MSIKKRERERKERKGKEGRQAEKEKERKEGRKEGRQAGSADRPASKHSYFIFAFYLSGHIYNLEYFLQWQSE